ncbi:MAG TPA: phosphate ABC transporter substrate-binding protein [Kamptonema sp.]|nr:phosphate ABC transporter substrate-binding protein [Kamptonema sp.]
MAKSSGPPPIVFILLFLGLVGAGYWFFVKKPAAETNPSAIAPGTTPPPPPTEAPPAAPVVGAAPAAKFSLPTSVPAGTVIKIDGSTSMVTINQNLKNGFQAKFAGTNVSTSAGGSNKGIADLVAGSVDLAALSRPLTSQEQSQGLVAVTIAADQIAVVVPKNNPFTGGLTSAQVQGIFTGKINNWSSVGGAAIPLQVVNRPPVSGTHQSFKELVLKGSEFGTTPNIKTMPLDTTTLLLRELGNNGIGYATYAQVANQQTVRVIPIDGVAPGTANYPFQRQLFYVYKNPPNPAVQAFLGYATSPEGRQAMLAGN